MADDTYTAVEDLYAAPGVRAARKGTVILPSNSLFKTWQAQGLLAKSTTKAAKDAQAPEA